MTATPPAPTVTGHLDAAPCPRVEVVVALPADAARVTITRTAPGLRSATVRGAANAVAAGAFLVVDHAAPFGVPITYTAVSFDVNGLASQASPSSASVTLAVEQIWLSDDLNPMNSMAVGVSTPDGVVITKGSLTSLTYAAGNQVVPVAGSDLPFGVGGVRQQASAVPFEFFTAAADSQPFLDLLGQAFPLCVRVPPVVRQLPPLLYASVSDVSRFPWGAEGDVWRLAIDSVRGPGLNVIIPTRTWDDVMDEAETWDALMARYPTWLDVLRG